MKQKKTYLLYNSMYKKHKIGVSTDVDNRVSSIGYNHKGTILVCVINYDVENLLHRNFLSRRASVGREREWFNLRKKDVEWIKRLSKFNKNDIDLLIEIANDRWEDGWNNYEYNRYLKIDFKKVEKIKEK